jgi:hypothetical protein
MAAEMTLDAPSTSGMWEQKQAEARYNVVLQLGRKNKKTQIWKNSATVILWLVRRLYGNAQDAYHIKQLSIPVSHEQWHRTPGCGQQTGMVAGMRVTKC